MEKRFISIMKESSFLTENTILLDTETGVCYLAVKEGYGLGVTPLLDGNGEPVVYSQDQIMRAKEGNR